MCLWLHQLFLVQEALKVLHPVILVLPMLLAPDTIKLLSLALSMTICQTESKLSSPDLSYAILSFNVSATSHALGRSTFGDCNMSDADLAAPRIA